MAKEFKEWLVEVIPLLVGIFLFIPIGLIFGGMGIIFYLLALYFFYPGQTIR